MIAADETLDGTWTYPARFTEAAGLRQHYVDEGPSRPGQTIVMLHGEPTWGYAWRHLIGPLSRHHRVVVPDHMDDIAVGMRDTALLPEYVIPSFRLSYPHAPVVEIPRAGHFPTEGRSRDAADTP
ncbi:hypothetical protein PV396_29860 [Streptomyces sp. ME02-8801-2C]|uniref:hypothetical protein n=1 Tax=Streptomyces sp. ME02-8801-2C TaxID=3028680 RepID=UPI0029A2C3D6|nr:hypothetical protein [Streptomyces sp. ME02-8801-2C]MDX3456098.1 hypothetical protein [Streptomyces sp. ME02-8801-2C]